MTTGFRNRILHVDLSDGTSRVEEPGEAVLRTYLGGGLLGTYILYRETDADLTPDSPDNRLILAPGVTTGAKVTGASRCSLTALSPLTGAVGDSQAGGNLGPAIKRAGYDAIVLRGRAAAPSYLAVDGETIEVRDAADLTGRPVLEVHDALKERLGGKGLCVVQCGPAGERQVRFASVHVDTHNVAGRTGLGAVFGSKNLRAVVLRGVDAVPCAEPDTIKELNRGARERLPEAGFPTILNKYGTSGVVAPQAEAGNLCTRNYSRGFHERYKEIDGATFRPSLGAGSRTCYGCVIACRKRVKADGPYPVSDRLGAPEFETLGLLGANLEIFDPVAVCHANELCNQYGLDTITVGGLAGYVFEANQRGLLPAEATAGRDLRFGDPESLFWLIERIAHREGIGDVLADGFSAAVAHFGAATAEFAVHTKDQGFAVHMPQNKPSLAVIYAANPFGPDHQSSEHDWLNASDGDEHWGLGLLAPGEATSTGPDKLRMTVFGQQYYSLLDTLCLCQFPWGAGSLFSYQDLETLLRATTGWRCSFFELMKAGERRITLMRQYNARRGLTREQDTLPARVFEPLPDGPSQGRHVDAAAFTRMLDQYYALMGWDSTTGNPTPAKLIELGLEWTLTDPDPATQG